MTLGKLLRKWAALIVVLVIGVLLSLILIATDTALSVWQRLQELSPLASALYTVILIIIATLSAVFAFSFLRAKPKPESEEKLSRDVLEQQLATAEEQGVKVKDAQKELEITDQRSASELLYIALFGEISTGKSTLIQALLPQAKVKVSPVGGTTEHIKHYSWEQPDAMPITLVDLPGVEQSQGESLAIYAKDEAIRAHLILYLIDSDLNRRQHQYLIQLYELNKPVLLVFNKTDHYSADELKLIEQKIAQQIPQEYDLKFIPISAGGTENVTLIDAEGNENQCSRPRKPDISGLINTIAKLVDTQRVEIEQQYEAASLTLVKVKLDYAQRQHRQQASAAIIKKYSKRAMIGALAAITPGSDLVIQGALASKLLAELAALYGRRLRDIDVDRFLSLAGSRLRNATSITLAVGGNALKAFPGIGTVSGALVHAVAYGMIFESIGNAVARALENSEHWQSDQTAESFEEHLLGHLETHSKDFAKLALQLSRSKKSAE